MLVWLLVFVLSAGAFGCSAIRSYINDGETYAGESNGNDLTAYFSFRECAFECGKGPFSTKAIAIVDDAVNTAGMRLVAVCDETGDEIELNDDGVGADTAAYDHVFYGNVSFDPAEEMTLHYRLKTKEGKSVQSSVVTITFYTVTSYEQEKDQLRIISEKLDSIRAIYEALEDTDAARKNEAYLNTLESMKAYLDEQIKNGVILSYEWDPPYFDIQLPIGAFIYSFEPFEDDTEAGGGSAAYETITTEDNKSLLLLPYDNDLDSSPFLRAFEVLTGADYGYTDTTLKNGAVDIDTMSSLQDYRVIVINTHGGFSNRRGPYFGIGVANEDIPMDDYANNYLITGSKGNALVTVSYFEHYYEDKSLNDCLIYLGSCHGADNDLLAGTLLRKGANAFLAYTHTVHSGYDGGMVRSLFNDLVKMDADQEQTHTIGMALQAAKNENGEKDPTNTDSSYPNYIKEEDRAELVLFEAQDMDAFRLQKKTETGAADWKELYREFIMNEGYKQFLQNGVDEWDGLWFALHDLDGNGIPELIFNDCGEWQQYYYDVCTIRNGRVCSVGQMCAPYGAWLEQDVSFLYFENNWYPGLFMKTNIDGYYQNVSDSYCGYYELENGGNVVEEVVEATANGKILTQTDTDALYRVAMYSDPQTLQFCGLNTLLNGGWDAFWTYLNQEGHTADDLWHAFAKSGATDYISMSYDEIREYAGELTGVWVDYELGLHYTYEFSDMQHVMFSFDTDLTEAEEAMDANGFIPGSVAARYIKGTDRCDGVCIPKLYDIGFRGKLGTKDIGGEYFKDEDYEDLWIASTEHWGYTFEFICDDGYGTISDQSACWFFEPLTEKTDQDFWAIIDRSALTRFISMPFGNVVSEAGELKQVDVAMDEYLRYLYSFSGMPGTELSFETDLYSAEEANGYAGPIPAGLAKRYIKNTDRCDGIFTSLKMLGITGNINAKEIQADVHEFIPDTDNWIAHTEHNGMRFYISCEDSSGRISENASCWIVADLPSQGQTGFWGALDRSGVLNYISMTYDEIRARAGTLEKVSVLQGAELRYMYCFSNLQMELSFESDLSQAEKSMDPYGYISGSIASQYTKGTDRCNGLLLYSLSDVGYYDELMASDIGARVYESDPDIGIWSAYIEHNGYDFYFTCDDDIGSISQRCAIMIVGHLPGQTPPASNTRSGWVNVGRSETTWQEGDWYYYVSGQPVTGWRAIDGKTYYFNRDGKMAYGFTTIDGVMYYFREHFEGAGPGTGSSPDHGALACGGFFERSIGDMVYTDTDGRVLAYDGGTDGDYFAYATKAFDLIWDDDALSYYDDVAEFGFYDIDGDGTREFYIKRGTCEADYTFEFYVADKRSGQYKLVGTIQGSHSFLQWENGRLYLIGGQMDDEWKYEIRLINGKIVLTDTSDSGDSKTPSKWCYDPYAARDSAEEVLNTIDGKGATYVSKLLREGGLTKVRQSGAGDLIDYLQNAKNWDGESIGKVVLDPAYSELHVGDVLCSVCAKGGSSSNYTNGHGKGSNLYYGIQVFFVSEVGSDHVRVYSKHNDRHNEIIQLSCNGGDFIDQCGKCGNSKNVHWIAFVFDDRIKP